jgi:hypothetical protein
MTIGLIVTATVLYQVSKLQKLFYRAIDAPEVTSQKYLTRHLSKPDRFTIVNYFLSAL